MNVTRELALRALREATWYGLSWGRIGRGVDPGDPQGARSDVVQGMASARQEAGQSEPRHPGEDQPWPVQGVHLCAAALLMVEHRGAGCLEARNELLFPRRDYLGEANDVVAQLAGWAEAMGFIRRTNYSTTLTDEYIFNQRRVSLAAMAHTNKSEAVERSSQEGLTYPD